MKPNVRPIFKRARPVAYARQPDLDKELSRLQQLGVITPINSSNWAAPVLLVKKSNGTSRLCNDYSTGLNAALESDSHPLPLPDDIFSTLNGKQIFSTIDFSDAYMQVKLDDESKQLCTINTPKGLFLYNRLPQGSKPAPGAFQRIMDAMLVECKDFARAYLDDIIVASTSMEEHVKNLYQDM